MSFFFFLNLVAVCKCAYISVFFIRFTLLFCLPVLVPVIFADLPASFIRLSLVIDRCLHQDDQHYYHYCQDSIGGFIFLRWSVRTALDHKVTCRIYALKTFYAGWIIANHPRPCNELLSRLAQLEAGQWNSFLYQINQPANICWCRICFFPMQLAASIRGWGGAFFLLLQQIALWFISFPASTFVLDPLNYHLCLWPSIDRVLMCNLRTLALPLGHMEGPKGFISLHLGCPH